MLHYLTTCIEFLTLLHGVLYFQCVFFLSVGKHRMLLDWQTVQHKFPWAIIFMIGGGFALSEGSSVSCTSAVFMQ